MAVDHVKSATITNLDASPVVSNTAGEGAAGALLSVTGIATGVASSSIDATYQMVRVPSTAKIKRLLFQTQTQAAGVTDVGLYYATDGVGGQATSLLVAATINRTLFASGIALTTTTAQDVTCNPIGSGFTPDKRNMPLWQAAGLTSDPGGFFDIVLSLTTAITTGTGIMTLEAQYVG